MLPTSNEALQSDLTRYGGGSIIPAIGSRTFSRMERGARGAGLDTRSSLLPESPMASLITLGGLARHVTEPPIQEPLPEHYFELSDEETAQKIAAAKAALGERLLVLGHHYQRDEIIRWADYVGDSFKLAQYGAQ